MVTPKLGVHSVLKTRPEREWGQILNCEFTNILNFNMHPSTQFTIQDLTPAILTFDAVLVSAAVTEDVDAVITRDKKLKKKASKLIPVLTPEEFLSA